MRIEIERSGGFAGIIKKIIVDTDKLPKGVANNIEKQLTKPKPLNKASRTMKSKIADCYYYKISCRIGNEKKEVKFSEFDVDQESRTIINSLLK